MHRSLNITILFFTELPIPTVVERKFRINLGELFTYKLPIFSDDLYLDKRGKNTESRQHYDGTNCILIGGPTGADISSDGILKWKAQHNNNSSLTVQKDNNIEFFVVKIMGPCKDETALIELSVHVVYDSLPIAKSNEG